ncbi:hypothetical protein V8C42DRAFT_347584 [Trichoderma barbatum]
MDLTSATSDSNVNIARALVEFFSRQSTSQEAVDQLMRFLRADPAFAPPDAIIYIDNMQARRELIRKTLQEAHTRHPYGPNFLQLAYFSLVSASSLAALEDFERLWSLQIEHMEHRISFLVRGWMPLGFVDVCQYNPTTIPPNIAEETKCVVRDSYRCILTGAANPDVCHIIPFAVNSSRANAEYSQYCRIIPATMSDVFTADRLHRLLTSEPGCSNKSWNMICLTPTLHSWWKKCLFAFKCIDIIPTDLDHARIRLQFHWMPRSEVNPWALAQPIERAVETMLAAEPEAYRATIGDSWRESGRPLETGHTFVIHTTPEEAFKMKVMIDAQWVVIRLAAISGLAWRWETRDDFVDLATWWGNPQNLSSSESE